MNLDAIEQATGDTLLIFRDQGIRTGARLLTVPVITTGIHRRDRLEVCRKCGRCLGAADGDDHLLHRLANHFDDARAELGELIQKQNTPVSK